MTKENLENNFEEELEVGDSEMTNSQQENENPVDELDNIDWEDQHAKLKDSYLRLNAEFDNYRKRTLKEKAEILKTGNERVLIDVVGIVDDFERALGNIATAQDLDAVKEGIELIYFKFSGFLTKHGVKEIEAIGQPFDVDKHEAITTIPAQKEADIDKIVDVIQKGYTLDDKVIRYPKVIVAK